MRTSRGGRCRSGHRPKTVTVPVAQLRIDRRLEEALVHGPDPLHLAEVFGLDEKTTTRYANSARVCLVRPQENHPATSHRTHGSTPDIRASNLRVPAEVPSVFANSPGSWEAAPASDLQHVWQLTTAPCARCSLAGNLQQ